MTEILEYIEIACYFALVAWIFGTSIRLVELEKRVSELNVQRGILKIRIDFLEPRWMADHLRIDALEKQAEHQETANNDD